MFFIMVKVYDFVKCQICIKQYLNEFGTFISSIPQFGIKILTNDDQLSIDHSIIGLVLVLKCKMILLFYKNC